MSTVLCLARPAATATVPCITCTPAERLRERAAHLGTGPALESALGEVGKRQVHRRRDATATASAGLRMLVRRASCSRAERHSGSSLVRAGSESQ